MDTETSRVAKLLADQAEEIVKLKKQNAELVEAAKVAENKLEIREGQFRGALGELIRTRQQTVELVEELWGIALESGSREASEMARAAIAKATGGE